MSVFFFSGRGLCEELITRPEESYRLWYIVVCDLENLKNEVAMTRVGSQRHRKKNYITTGWLASEKRQLNTEIFLIVDITCRVFRR